ncbi:putative serine/threonine protein phosphatase, related protein [Toxoplasma gondii MAS]|uniref:Putative serine/threonine protein phosphatase, related protein n=1 Tax=Toxoplasma gondii MAS TaxID=943118 RepID=A0A086Q5T5_TOXGO|nr:putative serine/threonine protein phosphatase, related protein [Toxoplasma gondii MAS]
MASSALFAPAPPTETAGRHLRQTPAELLGRSRACEKTQSTAQEAGKRRSEDGRQGSRGEESVAAIEREMGENRPETRGVVEGSELRTEEGRHEGWTGAEDLSNNGRRQSRTEEANRQTELPASTCDLTVSGQSEKWWRESQGPEGGRDGQRGQKISREEKAKMPLESFTGAARMRVWMRRRVVGARGSFLCRSCLLFLFSSLMCLLGSSAERSSQDSMPPARVSFSPSNSEASWLSEGGISLPPSFSSASSFSPVSRQRPLTSSSSASAGCGSLSPSPCSYTAASPAPSGLVRESLQSSYRIPVHMVGARAAVASISAGNQSLFLALDTQTEGVRLFLSNSTACTQLPSLSTRPSSLLGAAATRRKLLSESTKRLRPSAATPVERSEAQRDGEHFAQQARPQAGGDRGKILFQALPSLRRRGKKLIFRVAGDRENEQCYDPQHSRRATWCLNGQQACNFLSEAPYLCHASPEVDLAHATAFAHYSDGVRFEELRLEGLDLLRLDLAPPAPEREGGFSEPPQLPLQEAGVSPVKLVADRMSGFYDPYPGLHGVWGIAGPEFCCRNASLWSSTLLALNVTSYAFDLNFPSTQASSFAPPASRNEENGGFRSNATASALASSLDSAPLSFLHLGVLDEGQTQRDDQAAGAEALGRLKGFATYDEAGRWTGQAWRRERKQPQSKDKSEGENRDKNEGENTDARAKDGSGRRRVERGEEAGREGEETHKNENGETPNAENSEKRHATEEVFWGQRIQTGNVWADSVAHFVSYDWQLCGNSLMDASQTNDWIVTIDLSSECLVVPRPLWQSIRRWIEPALNVTSPLCALDDDFSSYVPASSLTAPRQAETPAADLAVDGGVYRLMCPLRSGRNAQRGAVGASTAPRPPLPVLSFALGDTSGVFDLADEPDGQEDKFKEKPAAARVELPLEQLVVSSPESAPSGEALCVVPQPHSILAREGRTVRLGTRAVAAFHFIVDQKRWRAGLLPKKLSLPSSNEACAAKATCRGEQTYVSATNECVDPPCSERLLFALNEETKICELAPAVVPAAVTVVVLLVALEATVVCFQWANVLRARTLT